MSVVDDEVSDSTLDKEFLSYLSLAEKCIRHKETKKCQKWFKKLCGKLYVDREGKRRRNAYLRRLLIAISKNKLVPPFDQEPPKGSLTSLNEIFRRSASVEGLNRYNEENEIEMEHESKTTEPVTLKPGQCKKGAYSPNNSKGADSKRQRYGTIHKPPHSKNGVSGKLVVTIDGKKTTHFNIDGRVTSNTPKKKLARNKSWPSSEVSSDENDGSRFDVEPGDHTYEHRQSPSNSKERNLSKENVQKTCEDRKRADSLESFPLMEDPKKLKTEKHISAEPKPQSNVKKRYVDGLTRSDVCHAENYGILFEEPSMADSLFRPDSYSYYSTRSKTVNGYQKRMSQTETPLYEYSLQSEANFIEPNSYLHSKQENRNESLKGESSIEYSNNSSVLRSKQAGQLAAGFDNMSPYDETFQPCQARVRRPPFDSSRISRASLSMVDRSRDRRSRYTNRPRSSEKMSTVEEKTESSASSPRYEGSRLGTRGFEPEPRFESNRKSRQETELRSRPETEVRSRQGPEMRSAPETEARSRQGTELRSRHEPDIRSRPETEMRSRHEPDIRSRPETEMRSRARSNSEPRSRSELLSRSKSVMSRIRDSLTPNRKQEADETSTELKVDVDTISLATAYDEFCDKQPESAQKNICALYRIYPTAIVDKLLELWKVEGQAVIADYKEIHRQRIELMKKEFKEDIDRRSEAFQEEKEDLRRWRDCKVKLDRMMDDLSYLHGSGASKEQRQLMEALRIEICEERLSLDEEKQVNTELKKAIAKMSPRKSNRCVDNGNLKLELEEVSEKLLTELTDLCNDYQEQRMTLLDLLNE